MAKASSMTPSGILFGKLSSTGHRAILLVILLLAAVLRIVQLDQLPPAIHADEAPNAWNAHTLLNAGQDQYGVPWPVFYTQAYGDYRTTSYVYAVIPFQFFGGLNVWTTRLPAAVAGVITVFLIYFVGTRMFGVKVGLFSAATLAVCPWHLQISRWGHEATLVPMFVMLSIASLLWANFPIDDKSDRPKVLMAALAGAVIGISCYGYSAVRLFLPIFLLAIVLVTWSGWLKLRSTREGCLAIVALLGIMAIFILPLLWVHLNDPAISERARILGWIWDPSDSMPLKATKVLARYIGHYSADFLFLSGDHDPALSSPKGFGMLHWYELPLMAVGLVALIRNAHQSMAAKISLIWFMLYPVGDILFPHVSAHSLRSLAGIGGLILIISVGAAQVGHWFWRMRSGFLKTGLAVVGAAVILSSHVLFVRSYFSAEFIREKSSHIVFGADILEATRWLRPHLAEAHAVFITGQAAHPDIVSLIGLNYDPQR